MRLAELQKESALQLKRYKELTGNEYPGDINLLPRKQGGNGASSSQRKLDDTRKETLPSIQTVMGAHRDSDGDGDDEMQTDSSLATVKRRGKQKERMEKHMHTFPVEATTPTKSRRLEERTSLKSHRYDPLSKGSRPGASKRRSMTPPFHIPRKRSGTTADLSREMSPRGPVLPPPPPPPVSFPQHSPQSLQLSPRSPLPRLRSPPLRQQRQPLPSIFRAPPLDSSTSGSSVSSSIVSSSIGPVRTVRKPSMRYDPIRDIHIQNDTPPASIETRRKAS